MKTWQAITNYVTRVNEHLRKVEADTIVGRHREAWSKEWAEWLDSEERKAEKKSQEVAA